MGITHVKILQHIDLKAVYDLTVTVGL